MNRTLPVLHSSFLDRTREEVRQDSRFSALLIGGSYILGEMDDHSDLDIVLIVEEGHYSRVLASRQAFAERLGSLIAAFSGEHVGEPRLLICLYGPSLLHVDLKFVTSIDLDQCVERPVVLFARDPESIEARLDQAFIEWPTRHPDWFEARVWVWLHYAATKLARGEYFEAIGMLAFFREQILGPLLARRAGQPMRGLRRVEARNLDPMGLLEPTLAKHNAESIKTALIAAIHAYLDLRTDALPSKPAVGMPQALFDFLDHPCPS